MTSNPEGGWAGYGLSDIGRVRASNQDAFAVLDQVGLWVVADGMGGHAGGDLASRIAVEAVAASVRSSAGPSSSQVLLRRAIRASNRAVLRMAEEHPDLAGMGTTLVVLHLAGPRPVATVAHVGDSRAYRLRAQHLTQLTEDHSLIEDYRRRGLVSASEAKTHPLRHVLSRAVGIEPEVEPDISTFDVEAEDVFLLCTDGLTRMLDDERIRDILLRSASRAGMCEALVREANRAGGEDNITVVIVSRAPDKKL